MKCWSGCGQRNVRELPLNKYRCDIVRYLLDIYFTLDRACTEISLRYLFDILVICHLALSCASTR